MNTPARIDVASLALLGRQLAALRVARNLTQAELAEQAGVSKRTVERLEAGGTATQLSTFLRVCAVLGLESRLAQLIPEPVESPVAQLRQQRRTRQRASGASKDASTAKPKPGTGWSWEA